MDWLDQKAVELESQLVVEHEVAEEEPPELRRSDRERGEPPRQPCRPYRALARPQNPRWRRHCLEPEGLLLRPFEPNLDRRFCKYKVNANVFIFRTYS